MLILGKIIALVLSSFFLGKITEKLIKILNKIANTFHIGQFVATAVIMAVATSLPELLVSVSASMSGLTDLALGNAIGSNIVNLSLVMGITAIAGKSLRLKSSKKIREDLGPLVYSFLPFFLAENGKISRIEGGFLLFVYVFYVVGLINKNKKMSLRRQIKNQLVSGKISMQVLSLIFWLMLLIINAQIIVWLAQRLATDLRLPVLLIGLFVVSLGTSLPELVFNIKAAKKKKVSMSTGNIVGSCVANATLVVGVAALINPIVVTNIYQMLLPGIEYAFIAIFVIWFAYSKHRIDAWEGVILVLLFSYYTGLSVLFK